MPTACIQQPGAKISLDSERLVVAYEDSFGHSLRRELPLHDIERLILSECISITGPALAEVLRRGIPTSWIDFNGRHLGSFHPAARDHGASRIRHYRRTLEPDFVLTQARKIVSAKIYNQRRLIQRIAANRRATGSETANLVIAMLESTARSMSATQRAESLDELRGHEGAAASAYFAGWAALLPAAFPFERRSKRPPLNPVNATLSFASTLIYHETHSFIHSHGLDAALGLLHTTENGRWSLALDLMEPFRPVLAEALTLDLFSHSILTQNNFETRDGGTFLTKDGRGKLLLQYEKRMERQFLCEMAGHRTTLRQQLENQIRMFKSSLDDPDAFEPFLMN